MMGCIEEENEHHRHSHLTPSSIGIPARKKYSYLCHGYTTEWNAKKGMEREEEYINPEQFNVNKENSHKTC